MRNVAAVYFSEISPHFQAHPQEKGMPEHVVVYSAHIFWSEDAHHGN